MARKRRRKKKLRVPSRLVLSAEQIDACMRAAPAIYRDAHDAIRSCFILSPALANLRLR